MASRGVNKVILIGNLGQDPDMRYMPDGNAVVNLSIATSQTWKDKNTGEPQERTEWHRLVAFRRLAEVIGEYLKKGSKVYIEGHLQTRKWQDQSGNDRYTTEVVVDDMQMLDSRGQGQQNGGYANQQQGNQQGNNQRGRFMNNQQGGFNQQAGFGNVQPGFNQQEPPDPNAGADGGFDDDIPF